MWNWNDLFLESLAALNFWEWYVFGVNFLSLFISKNLNFQKSWKNGTANPYAPFLLLSIYPMLTFYHILVSLGMSVHTCRCALHGPYAHFPKAMGLLLLLKFRIQSRTTHCIWLFCLFTFPVLYGVGFEQARLFILQRHILDSSDGSCFIRFFLLNWDVIDI